MRDYYDRQFDREEFNDKGNTFSNGRYNSGITDFRHKRVKDVRTDTRDRSWWDKAGDEMLSWLGDDYAERRRRRDETNNRGKGPKNYKRADERIREDVNDRLTDEWNVDASDIVVSVTNGEVILTGYVTDRTQKRRAADVAEQVSGVRNVENRLKVEPHMPPDNVSVMP